MNTSVEDRASEDLTDDAVEAPPVTLMVPPEVRLDVTADDFERLSRANPGLHLERSAEGALVAMSIAAPDVSLKCASLSAQLWLWNRQSGLGIVFDSSAGFTLPNSAIRSPDASWMTLSRWEQIPQADRSTYSHACPDFVGEIRLSDDSPEALGDKMEEYIAQGAKLGWLIDPIRGTAEIYRPGRPVEVLDRPATLSGEDVLPGFVLDLKGILFD